MSALRCGFSPVAISGVKIENDLEAHIMQMFQCFIWRENRKEAFRFSLAVVTKH